MTRPANKAAREVLDRMLEANRLWLTRIDEMRERAVTECETLADPNCTPRDLLVSLVERHRASRRAAAADQDAMMAGVGLQAADPEWWTSAIEEHGLTEGRAMHAAAHEIGCQRDDCPEHVEWEQVRALLEGGPH